MLRLLWICLKKGGIGGRGGGGGVSSGARVGDGSTAFNLAVLCTNSFITCRRWSLGGGGGSARMMCDGNKKNRSAFY